MKINKKSYLSFVEEIKKNIQHRRYLATSLVNREMLALYFSTGKAITEKIQKENWGNAVIDTLSADLQKSIPGLRGFSAKNLRNMRQFYEAYANAVIWQLPTAKIIKKGKTEQYSKKFIDNIFSSISFTHHMMLLNKCRDKHEREFYMEHVVSHQWSVSLLQHHIESNLYRRKGKLVNNFRKTLPGRAAKEAMNTFKDEYLLDFINVSEEENERELESHVIANIKQFILSLGRGFTFIGNQYRLLVGEEEFFSDLLFYNRILQCLVVIELKSGKFKPEHAGKLNFYLNLLDDKVKLPHENNSIGIILCKEKNNAIIEYAFRSIGKAMGVATYKTSKLLPQRYKKVLPDADTLRKLLKKGKNDPS
jgi:predicted nuclease of restriction endonuclease-like (RecB) superfamily